MSLLIKGMEMPKNGQITIELASEDTGTNILARITDNKTGKLIGHEGVVAIPSPHGRLIDADVLMDLLEKSVPEKNRGHQFYAFRHMLRNAPTVIEAEE